MQSVKNITSLMDNPSVVDKELIEKAYLFSQNAHRNHERRSGEPYFNHVYETAISLAEFGMGPQTIAAGLLMTLASSAIRPMHWAGNQTS